MKNNHSLVILDDAWQDIDKIADSFRDMAGADSADRIANQMLDEIEILCEFPFLGPVHPDPELAVRGYRKLVLTRTYVAIYKVIGGTVYIHNIVNGRTDYPKLLK